MFPAERYLRRLDLVEFARSFLQAVQTLERVRIEIIGLRSYSRQEVQVLRDETISSCVMPNGGTEDSEDRPAIDDEEEVGIRW